MATRTRRRTKLVGANGTVLGDIEPPPSKILQFLPQWIRWLYNLFNYIGIVNENFLTVEDWNTVTTLSGSWTTAGGRTVGYYIDPYGRVHIRGAATGGTGVIFTLPTGYRPDQAGFFACYQGGIAEVAVQTNGDVEVTAAGTGAVSLDPISFRI